MDFTIICGFVSDQFSIVWKYTIVMGISKIHSKLLTISPDNVLQTMDLPNSVVWILLSYPWIFQTFSMVWKYTIVMENQNPFCFQYKSI